MFFAPSMLQPRSLAKRVLATSSKRHWKRQHHPGHQKCLLWKKEKELSRCEPWRGKDQIPTVEGWTEGSQLPCSEMAQLRKELDEHQGAASSFSLTKVPVERESKARPTHEALLPFPTHRAKALRAARVTCAHVRTTQPLPSGQ